MPRFFAISITRRSGICRVECSASVFPGRCDCGSITVISPRGNPIRTDAQSHAEAQRRRLSRESPIKLPIDPQAPPIKMQPRRERVWDNEAPPSASSRLSDLEDLEESFYATGRLFGSSAPTRTAPLSRIIGDIDQRYSPRTTNA